MENRRELPGEREPILASYLASSAGAEPEEDDLQAVVKYSLVVWKRKWVVLLGIVLGVLAGIAISLRTTPMYRTSTSLEIQIVQEPFKTLLGADIAIVTHAELLQSSAVRAKATAQVVDSQVVPPIPHVTTVLSTVREWLGLADPEAIPWSQAVAVAAGAVSVTMPKDSRVLTLQTESPNPQAAADFANAVVEQYIQKMADQRWEDYQKMNGMLDRANAELKGKLEKSEDDVTSLAKSAGLIVMTSETQSGAEQNFRHLQEDLARARSERTVIEAKYKASLSSSGESLPAVLDSGPMATYQSGITELRKKLAELLTTFTPEHYKVREIQDQLEDLQGSMERERKNVSSRLAIEFQAAKEREDGLMRELETQTRGLADQAQKLGQYNMLKREAEINTKLYASTLQQGKEASVSSAISANNARVVDRAKVPKAPYKPDLRFNVTLGMLGGLCIGALGAVLLSRLDASIKNPGLLESYFNVRELGAIPSAKSEGLGVLTRRAPIAIGDPNTKSGFMLKSGESSDPLECLELVTWTRQRSVMSEAFRAVMTSVLFSSQNADQARVLLVTSPATQEGKSTIISNLAIALAEIGQRVLLIDADMRLPRIHAIFGLPNTFGLSGVLNERAPIGDYDLDRLVTQTFVPNLQVMPAGEAPTSFARLLHSGRMKDLIERFRGEFDTILIDSAPVLTVPDARVLARSADAVILVFRANKTTQEAAMAVAKCLEEDGTRVLGTILNDWNPNSSGKGYGRSYGAYSQYHNTGGAEKHSKG